MSSASFSSTSVKSTSPNPRGIDNAPEEPQQVSLAASVGEQVNLALQQMNSGAQQVNSAAQQLQKTIKDIDLRDHDTRSRTKSLVEKERKIQQREQQLVDKERAAETKERSMADREKKLAAEERKLQDERKRHTEHMKASLASLQQTKQSTSDLEQRIAVLQQNYAEAAAERDALRDQLTQRDQPELSKEQAGAVHLHTADERPTEQWSRYPQHYNPHQPYEAEPDHEEDSSPPQQQQQQQPQQQAPYYPPVHHPIPYPMAPQQYHPHYKYPPNRGYGYHQPFYPIRAGYAPGMYPPPGVFPPRQTEPRAEQGEDENGETPEWRDQGYGQQGSVEEDHQDRQRSHLSNYQAQPQYNPPAFWGADSQ